MGGPVLAGASLPSNAAPAQASSTVGSLVAGEGWPAQRQVVERAWLDLLGDFPKDVPSLDPVLKKVAYEGGITRYHASFQAEPGDRVTAWLLVPDSARERPTPAIIVVHSTTFGSGKDSTAGLAGRRPQDPPTDPAVGRASGLDLARHGYITLCIDLLTDGERIPQGGRVMDTRWFYQSNPEWSIVGKNTWDIMRCVDFLHTLEWVDKPHIGIIGWSLGGHTALFAAAFEPRITATISNGGVLDWTRHSPAWARKPTSWKPWVTGDTPTTSPEMERRFGFPTNSGPYIYIKKFRAYIDDPAKPIPVDFDSLMAMVAPRPLMIISSEQEFYRHKIMPKCLEALKVYVGWKSAPGLPDPAKARQERRGWQETLKYYQENHNMAPEKMPGMMAALGAGDCFGWFSFPGGHSYPPVARRHTFAWFDRWLGYEPPAKG